MLVNDSYEGDEALDIESPRPRLRGSVLPIRPSDLDALFFIRAKNDVYEYQRKGIRLTSYHTKVC